MPRGEKVPLAQISSRVICFVGCATAMFIAANIESKSVIRLILLFFFNLEECKFTNIFSIGFRTQIPRASQVGTVFFCSQTNESTDSAFCPSSAALQILLFIVALSMFTKKRMLHYQHPLAERQGFEPWDQASWLTVFETAPIDHSGIFP